MKAGLRERIALIVFFCLIVVGLGGLIGYIAIGHSWNVAASNIDDAAGSMSGYTVVVYPGTVSPVEQAKDGSLAGGSLTDGSQPGALPTNGLQADASPTDGTPAGSPQAGPDGAATGGQAPQDGAGAVQTGAAEAYQGLDEAEPSTDIGAVQDSYRAKNAAILSLDTQDLGRYEEGTILKTGGYRFGVFSVTDTDYEYKVRRQVSYFALYHVDFIVVLTSDMGLVTDVRGIDIVISTKDEGLFVMGETRNNTFYVSAPASGSVGAILISPSKVVSAKVINS